MEPLLDRLGLEEELKGHVKHHLRTVTLASIDMDERNRVRMLPLFSSITHTHTHTHRPKKRGSRGSRRTGLKGGRHHSLMSCLDN